MSNSAFPTRGVVLAVFSTAMFALLSPYGKLLFPLNGVQIFAWRIVWTLPAALLILASQNGFSRLLKLALEVPKSPSTAMAIIGCAGMLGFQQWLFMWAPLHGRMLDLSLGYFLLPIVMVLAGWAIDRQRIHSIQWLAVAFAFFAVAHEVFVSHAFSWPTIAVAFGFPPYFILRRRLNYDSLSIFCAEMLVLFPVACVIALGDDSVAKLEGRTYLFAFLLPALGALSAICFICYLKASRSLPLPLFGLLGYVEPILLAFLSVALFQEEMSDTSKATYVALVASMLSTAVYVFKQSRGRKAVAEEK